MEGRDRYRYGRPSNYIIETGLHLRNDQNDTPLHYAAQFGFLSDIPIELLTKENFSVTNNNGWTPMHDAAQSGGFEHIPSELITEELLTVKDKDGGSPLYFAKVNNRLDELLGVEFSAAVIDEVGEEWYARNQQVIQERKMLEATNKVAALELF